MTPWTADQLPEIARRVLAEEFEKRQADMHMDPHRVQWAEWVLRNQRAEQPKEPTCNA